MTDSATSKVWYNVSIATVHWGDGAEIMRWDTEYLVAIQQEQLSTELYRVCSMEVSQASMLKLT